MAVVSVFKIEYTIDNSEVAWTAFVGAFTHEEAVRHVEQRVKKPIKITASGLHSRLDDISFPVRNTVVNQAVATNVGVKTEESKLEEETLKAPKRKMIKA